MGYLLTFHAGWLLAALAIGAVTGWMTFVPGEAARSAPWLRWTGLGLAIAALVAVVKVAPQRFGYWIELGVLFLLAYALGCLLGAWLRGRLASAETSPATGHAAAFTAMPPSSAGSTSPAAQKPVPAAAKSPQPEPKPAAPVPVVDNPVPAPSTPSPTMPTPASGAGGSDSVPGPAPALAGQKPVGLAAPRTGGADDLTLIRGIGPKNEAILHGLGVWHFDQIADWRADEVAWVNGAIAFPGRIEREHWIAQARLLAAGIETDHAAAVRAGTVKASDAALDEAEGAALGATLPVLAAAVEDEGRHGGRRPLGLAAPRGKAADDLKQISGIGRQNEQKLHALGIFHFDQIAAWTPENVAWAGSYLAFPGRIDRENWVAQAKTLAAGLKTEFAKRVEQGLVPTSLSEPPKD